MIQVCPFSSGQSDRVPADTILRPRPAFKLCQQEVLHWYQYVDLIAEVILERFTAVSETRAVLSYHLLLVPAGITGAKMMPAAETYRGLMWLDKEAPAGIGDMLDTGVTIEMAKQHARQATAVHLYCFHPDSVILADPGSLADHYAPVPGPRSKNG